MEAEREKGRAVGAASERYGKGSMPEPEDIQIDTGGYTSSEDELPYVQSPVVRILIDQKLSVLLRVICPHFTTLDL